MFDLDSLVRDNIRNLNPYSSARDEYHGNAKVFLDANENALGSVIEGKYNRYPDPLQRELKNKISTLKNIDANSIFIGNGSDEAIDLLFRVFCNPSIDNVVSIDPTYGMYEVCANINDVQIRKAELNSDYSLNSLNIFNLVDEFTKLIFICNPNNPTGNILDKDEIVSIIENFSGIVVIDEAYIDFSENDSFIKYLDIYPNLVILQTFSKAWGLANLRVGMAFSSVGIIRYFNITKMPYNVNGETQRLALESLFNIDIYSKNIKIIILERERLKKELNCLNFVLKVYDSDSNFLIIRVLNADDLYHYLLNKGIVVRNRSSQLLCDESLRITVGTIEENNLLIQYLKEY